MRVLVWFLIIVLVAGCGPVNRAVTAPPSSEPGATSTAPTSLATPLSSNHPVSRNQPSPIDAPTASASSLKADKHDPASVALAFTYALINNDQASIKELWRHETLPNQSLGYFLVNGNPPTIYEKPRVENDSLRQGKGPGYIQCDVLAKVHSGNGGYWYRFVYTLINQTSDEWKVTGFSQPIFQGPDDPTLKSDYLRPWKRASFTFTFVQELEPNRWLAIPTAAPEERGIILLSLAQDELVFFNERFAKSPLKGVTLIVKGEDSGLDELGRKVFIVKGNSGLIPPEMP